MVEVEGWGECGVCVWVAYTPIGLKQLKETSIDNDFNCPFIFTKCTAACGTPKGSSDSSKGDDRKKMTLNDI